MSYRPRTVPRSLARQSVQVSQTAHVSEKIDRSRASMRASQQYSGYASTLGRFSGPAQQAPSYPAEATDVSYNPEVVFGSAPMSKVRWVNVGSREAVAAVGTSDGSPGADSIILHAVVIEGKEISARIACHLEHSGKVSDISATSDTGMLYSASSDGAVRCMHISSWDSEPQLQPVTSLPKTTVGVEPAVGVAPLASTSVVVAGGHGTLMVSDVERKTARHTIYAADAIGFRALASIDPAGGQEIATAGASGTCALWDVRTAHRNHAPVQRLKHPNPAVWPMSLTVDASQPHFVLAGTSVGELAIWDRRAGDGMPLSRITLHDGFVWDLRVVASLRPGLLLSCGEDARVWLMDFAAAGSRGGVSGSAAAWRETGEFWRAELGESDVRNVSASAGATLGVNSVDAHPETDLFAYVSDSAVVTFGSLYSQQGQFT